jgi:hypothetical protein
MIGRRIVLVSAMLGVLSGCGGGRADWARAGADQATVGSEYQDCLAMAGSAVKTEADIDQDILATRGDDWRRAGVGRLQVRTMREHTRDRGTTIVDACMRAKGFARVP